MSYCRFGWGGSNVYVYESDAGIECCGCCLGDTFVAPCGVSFDEGDHDNSPEHREAAIEMVRHLRRHRAAGHNVPLGAPYQLSVEAGKWTRERIWGEVTWRWWRAMRQLCRVIGHRDISAFPEKANTDGLPDEWAEACAEVEERHRECARCGLHGFRTDGSVTEWWAL